MDKCSRNLGEWQEYLCPCGAHNFVFDYFNGDITSGEDTEAIHCWKCGQTTYAYEEMISEGIAVCSGYDSPEDCCGIKDGLSPQQLIDELKKLVLGCK